MPWLPELFAMAEDMRVLDEMLADGGLKVGSEEVEAYKYNYRCNFTNITITTTDDLVSSSIGDFHLGTFDIQILFSFTKYISSYSTLVSLAPT